MKDKRILGKILTTGQVARVCSVSLKLAVIWCDKGFLKSYKIPNAKKVKARRVLRQDLFDFMDLNGMPRVELLKGFVLGD
jgi:two-component system, OmpR family, response regulator VicR